jgi:hypothetical protein
VIPSIYAADSVEGALMESVLHNVPFPSAGYQHDFKLDRKDHRTSHGGGPDNARLAGYGFEAV